MNGYIQIQINGEAVGLKFGYLAVKEFSLAAEKKKDLYYDKVKMKDEKGEEKETDQLSFLGIAKLLHCGYKNNCEIKEVEPKLSFETFSDWVEGSVNNNEVQQQLADALTVFTNSQYVKSLAEMSRNGSETEEAKKKTAKVGSRKLSPAS